MGRDWIPVKLGKQFADPVIFPVPSPPAAAAAASSPQSSPLTSFIPFPCASPHPLQTLRSFFHLRRNKGQAKGAAPASKAPPAAPRMPDFGLGGLYEPLMPLGKGGTGETYLMREKTTDKLVAIKVRMDCQQQRVIELEGPPPPPLPFTYFLPLSPPCLLDLSH
jgi:hypothetical protein